MDIRIMRRGFTLVELVTVITTIGALLAILAPRLVDAMDRIAVRRAREETASFYSTARFGAILRGARVRIVFGDDSLFAVYESDNDSVFLRQDGPAKLGVDLSASRGIIRILPTGIGSGGSNTTLVFRRGVVAESLTTSRLGRLRRW